MISTLATPESEHIELAIALTGKGQKTVKLPYILLAHSLKKFMLRINLILNLTNPVWHFEKKNKKKTKN